MEASQSVILYYHKYKTVFATILFSMLIYNIVVLVNWEVIHMAKHPFLTVFTPLISVSASALNLLYIADIIGFKGVRAGLLGMNFSIFLNMIIYKEKGGPFYYKNWRKHPKTSILFFVCLLFFIVTFIVALLRDF